MKAIVYTSQTGSAAEYAGLLGKAVGLPVYTVSEAKKALAAGDEILYIGWVMASVVQGYKASAARYRVVAGSRTERSDPRQNGRTGQAPALYAPGQFCADQAARDPEAGDENDARLSCQNRKTDGGGGRDVLCRARRCDCCGGG